MALWLADRPLVLASRSDARRRLLERAAIPIEIVPADIDERAIESKAGVTDPGEVASLLAREKALYVSNKMPGRLVLGADQALGLNRLLFTKPPDRTSARRQLMELQGTTHELHSALACARDGESLFAFRKSARLTMRVFSDSFLDRYLDAAGAAATSSVGGYQIEGAGIHLFEQIQGDYFTILGLPLLELFRFLRHEGLLAE